MKSRCYCITLRRASRRLTSTYDAALEPFGINLAQYSLLKTVVRLGPVSLTDLAHTLDLDRSTVGRNARVMVRMGLIAMGPGKDQREQALGPTARGRALLAEATPIWAKVQHDIDARLGPGKVEQLQELLAEL
ncbi:MAG: MarR family winged helix-turn-helix transcriptional regulator [Hyphomicrobiales bacterium]|nr:MarR family winged helix-turn-helix transcriptional regulator [Hyphomicrobiales bacterium]